jgi:hypothetical protein
MRSWSAGKKIVRYAGGSATLAAELPSANVVAARDGMETVADGRHVGKKNLCSPDDWNHDASVFIRISSFSLPC